MKHSNDQDEVDDIDDIGDPENIPPLNLYYCNAMKIKTSNFNFANSAIHLQLHMTTGTKNKGSMFFYGTKVRSLCSLVSNWQTHKLFSSRLDWCDSGWWRCLCLGKGPATKSDEFVEKFQTALTPPPHFWKIMLQIFYKGYGCIRARRYDGQIVWNACTCHL